jgi:hypothetical protein
MTVRCGGDPVVSPYTILLGIVFGSIGIGFFIYGRKQKRFTPLLSGVMLWGMPYTGFGPMKLVLIGIVLVMIPFVIET